MAQIKKLQIDDETLYAVTIPQAVVDPDSNKTTREELDGKVDKVTGKQLSTEDYTTAEKSKVTNLPLNTTSELALKFDKANLESARSQSTTKAPTSKLVDDELKKIELNSYGIDYALYQGKVAPKNLNTLTDIKNPVAGYYNRSGVFVSDPNFSTQLVTIDNSKAYRIKVSTLGTYLSLSTLCLFDSLGKVIDINWIAYDGYFVFPKYVKKFAVSQTNGQMLSAIISTVPISDFQYPFAEKSIQGSTIADRSIAFNKISFYEVGKNKLNINDSGLIIGTLIVGSNGPYVLYPGYPTWFTSPLIDVSQHNGSTVIISTNGSVFSFLSGRITFVDANNNILLPASLTNTIIPTGAKYMRFSHNTGLTVTPELIAGAKFMITIGAPGEYESYRETISSQYLPTVNLPNTSVEVILPDTIYAVVGDTLQLFYRGMIKHPNPYVYNILVSCANGKQYQRYFEYIPVAGDVGTTTFTVTVKDKDGIILGLKTCNLVTKAAVKSPTTTKKVLCVGDSLTAGGYWPQEASRRLIGAGGVPAGLSLSNISFLGRKTGSGIGWEGNGGWYWDDYSGPGREAYKFVLSGVTTAPGIGSTYTNNGVTYTVTEVNITEGTGYISATGGGAPTASGTLTKASGAGDATLTFSAYSADSGNPFWESDTNSLDFPQYVNTYMGGGCDVIYFLLTWNAQTVFRTNFSSMIASAKTLIDHIHTNYPDCKIKIMGVQVPSLNGGMGANYGATGTGYADMYGMVVTALNMNKAYQDWCNEAAYSVFMEFVNVSAQFDSENNMPETDKAVNTRATKTEKIGTNGVHPSTEGYYQIADVVFRNFVASFCQ